MRPARQRPASLPITCATSSTTPSGSITEVPSAAVVNWCATLHLPPAAGRPAASYTSPRVAVEPTSTASTSGSAAARDTLVISLLCLPQPAIPRPGAGTGAVERADHDTGPTAASSYPSPPHEPDGRHAAGIRARTGPIPAGVPGRQSMPGSHAAANKISGAGLPCAKARPRRRRRTNTREFAPGSGPQSHAPARSLDDPLPRRAAADVNHSVHTERGQALPRQTRKAAVRRDCGTLADRQLNRA